jgi:hypothetical protein
MIRTALLLCAGLLAAACFACVVGPQPPVVARGPGPGTPGVGPLAITGPTCPDGSLFFKNVQYVQGGWDPDPQNPADPPPVNGSQIGSTPFAPALQNAFLLAPADFQARLCSLTATIYVNGTACSDLGNCMQHSWGYRGVQTGHTYIGISAGLWSQACPDGSLPYAYHCFETELLDSLLGWTGPQYLTPNPPDLPGDTFDTTILAALAHEVGHVRWYQVMNPDQNNNRGRPYNPSGFCGGTFFTGWRGSVNQPPYWRGFGNRAADVHRAAPQIAWIDAAIHAQHWDSAATYLDQLYQPYQPWASFFGALSPDEDFVETYKLHVLTNAQSGVVQGEGPLTSLPIMFVSGTTEDIPKTYGTPSPGNYGAPLPANTLKSTLTAKAVCIGQNL